MPVMAGMLIRDSQFLRKLIVFRMIIVIFEVDFSVGDGRGGLLSLVPFSE